MQSIKIKILIATGALLIVDILVGASAYAAFPEHQKDLAGVPAIMIGVVIAVVGYLCANHAGRVEEKILTMNS